MFQTPRLIELDLDSGAQLEPPEETHFHVRFVFNGPQPLMHC